MVAMNSRQLKRMSPILLSLLEVYGELDLLTTHIINRYYLIFLTP